ncbi:NAD-binding protein [Longispora sp. NPDC051575]|uniref:NAD-binding protein n=1 Tax=Longispora sp. NPDC051575 TaxID=3154943 RepID=UPI003438D101
MSPVLPRRVQRRHFVVCGDNPLAFRLAEELTKKYGENVTVILRSKRDNHGPDISRLPGVRIVESTRLDEDTFRAAGLPEARALALVQHGDVENIHAALRAQDLHPGLRLVVRMSSTSLGRRMHELFDDCTALSDAAIAAPAFVVAALNDPTLNVVRLPGQTLRVAHRDSVPEDQVLCTLTDPTESPSALLPEGSRSTDLVLALATGTPEETAPAPPKRRAPAKMLWDVLRFRKLWIALLVGLGVMAVAATVWSELTGKSWLSSLYEMMMTSAGSGQVDHNLHGPERVVQVAVTLAGLVILVPIATALAVEFVVNTRLAIALNKPRTTHSGHVVVIGLGNVGTRVVRQLHDLGIDVVAIDANEKAIGVPVVRSLGREVIVGDASRRDTLLAAGVDTCRALLTITSDDATNLDAGLLGKELQPDLWVTLRLFDGDLAHRVEKHLGITRSRSVSYMAAPAFAAAMIDRKAIQTIPVGRRVLLVAELPLARGSELVGARLSAAHDSGEVRVIAMRNGGRTGYRPSADHLLAVGDRITVVATRAGLGRLLPRTVSRSTSE